MLIRQAFVFDLTRFSFLNVLRADRRIETLKGTVEFRSAYKIYRAKVI